MHTDTGMEEFRALLDREKFGKWIYQLSASLAVHDMQSLPPAHNVMSSPDQKSEMQLEFILVHTFQQSQQQRRKIRTLQVTLLISCILRSTLVDVQDERGGFLQLVSPIRR